MRNALLVKYIRKREISLLLTILVLGAVIAVSAPEFLQPGNLLNILVNNAMYGIMAVGMTLVLVTGNIDISVGAQFAVIGVIAATFANFAGSIGLATPLAVFVVAILLGTALGYINGFLASKIRLPAVILTLGTMSIMRGTLLITTKGSWVTLPTWFTGIASQKFLGVHILIYLWLLVAALMVLLLRYTMLGRNILAMGGNPVAALRIGINREWIYRFVFAAFGATVGIASTIYIAQLGSAQPAAGTGYEFTVVGATVIGGNSLLGGKASVVGTCLGVLLLGIVRNAMVLMHIPVYWQSLVTGLILVLAILLSFKNETR
jgi:ribose/xylose/arabinose/galactoside ABC-type transport system permease subunit